MKNRERDQYSFANINLMGKCNINCFFCLGKEIEDKVCDKNHLKTYFHKWHWFELFLGKCKENNIKKIYLTGQNCDPLQYEYLGELIEYLKSKDFLVGIRTNGFLAEFKMDEINTCNDEVGYSVHTFNPLTSKMMVGTDYVPNWDLIFDKTKAAMRTSVVVNRCNQHEFFDIIQKLSGVRNNGYIQVRKVSTDLRYEDLAPDMKAYEEIYTVVSRAFPLKSRFVKDAEIYRPYGKDVVFWRTVKTSVNSINYFTDGTISDNYFIVEGYLENANVSTIS